MSVLNDFYSTNIFKVFSVAKHIQSINNIDYRMSSGDVELVNEIAKITIEDKEKNFYSFATKYCSHHNQNDYPIYDYYVVKMLLHFKKKDHFCEFKRQDLKDYPKFKSILEEFRKKIIWISLSKNSIDIFGYLEKITFQVRTLSQPKIKSGMN